MEIHFQVTSERALSLWDYRAKRKQLVGLNKHILLLKLCTCKSDMKMD